MGVERRVRFVEVFPLLVTAFRGLNAGDSGKMLSASRGPWAQHLRDLARRDRAAALEAVRVVLSRGLATRLLGVLEEWGCTDLFDESIIELLRSTEALYVRMAEAQRELSRAVAQELAGSGVSPIMMKGNDIADRFADPRHVDPRYDVDLLIQWDEYDAVRNVLVDKIGMVQGEFSGGSITPLDDPRTEESSASHYEWWPFLLKGPSVEFDPAVMPLVRGAWPFAPGEIDGNRVDTYIALDLHYGIDPDIPVSVALDRAVPYRENIRALSPTCSLWFISGRLYHETIVAGAQKFRSFGQVLDLLNRATIDWDDLSDLTERYRTEPAVYYVLQAASQFVAFDPPRGWIEALKASFMRRGHLHDFGPLWPSLLRLDRDEILTVCPDDA